jgi:hypothetical protein
MVVLGGGAVSYERVTPVWLIHSLVLPETLSQNACGETYGPHMNHPQDTIQGYLDHRKQPPRRTLQ